MKAIYKDGPGAEKWGDNTPHQIDCQLRLDMSCKDNDCNCEKDK